MNIPTNNTVAMIVNWIISYTMPNTRMFFNLYMLYVCLAGLFLTTTPSMAVTLAEGSKDTTTIHSVKYTNRIGNPPMHTDKIIPALQAGHQPDQALTVPESNTVTGIAAALVLNGIGLVGSRYYLRRKCNRESAKRYASRYTTHLPIYVDTMLSVLVILIVSPVLLTVAAAGALKTGVPKVYRCTKTQTTPINNEFVGTESM
jgi:hypothetical protein